MNLKVGKEVLLVEDGINSGRWARNNKQPYKTYNATITKIGKKYFTVNTSKYDSHELRFEIDSLRQVTDYVADYSLYENEEAYNRAEQLQAMRNTVFGYTNLRYNIETLSDEDLLVVFDVVSKYIKE